MPTKELYKSFLEGKQQDYSDQINQSVQRSAEKQVERNTAQKRARTDTDYKASVARSRSKDRARALAAMANPREMYNQDFYPQFRPKEKRVSAEEEQATRSFNQRDNVSFMRDVAKEAQKAGDLKSARRYNQYAEESELKQRKIKKQLMTSTSEEISDDIRLMGTIDSQDKFDVAKVISNMNGRPLFQDEELMIASNGGRYNRKVGEMLYGRMLDLKQARENLGLDISVENGAERFNYEKKSASDENIKTKNKTSAQAKMLDNIIEGTRKKEEEAIGKLPTNFRRKADGISIEPIPGGPDDPSIPHTDAQRRSAMLGAEAENILTSVKDIIKPNYDKTTGRNIGFNPTDRQYIKDAILVQGPIAGAIAGGAIGAASGLVSTGPVGGGIGAALGAATGGIAGAVGPAFADENFKEYHDNMRGLVALTLYNKSGQALTNAEWEAARGTYIPWPGDSARNATRKLRNLEVAVAQFKTGKPISIPMSEPVAKAKASPAVPPEPPGTRRTTSEKKKYKRSLFDRALTWQGLLFEKPE